MADFSQWTGCKPPEARILEGNTVRLEPLRAKEHGDDLYHDAIEPAEAPRFDYLMEYPPKSRADFDEFLRRAEASHDPLFFAVVDKATGRAVGRQSFLRIEPKHGVIEIGHIYWGPLLRGRRQATEAQFLFADYAFNRLGYRRYEWKCNNDNLPSKKAAARFGFAFEGVFRQHMVSKGKNRDTAWFSIIDEDWVKLRPAYIAWLADENFDAHSQQKQRLSDLTARALNQA